MVILAHDIGKILTLSADREGQPHDIPSADIVASLPELREDFDEMHGTVDDPGYQAPALQSRDTA